MSADETQRASPDALLALAKKEGRGHLKIFLGAAPGVGKTYAMLTSARSEMQGGRVVVAGLIETHGRRETEAMVEGFELLPRRPIVYARGGGFPPRPRRADTNIAMPKASSTRPQPRLTLRPRDFA